MSYRLGRMSVLGFLIALPLLTRVVSAPAWSGGEGGAWSQVAFMAFLEIILVGGLIVADWNRRRLLVECLERLDRARVPRVPVRTAAVRFGGGAMGADTSESLLALSWDLGRRPSR